MKAIQEALELADKLQHVFVATADAKGMPHVAAAGKLKLESDGRVPVTAWFCPGTVDNLQHNHRIALEVRQLFRLPNEGATWLRGGLPWLFQGNMAK